MNKVIPITATAVGALGVGFSAGYIFAMRRANKKITVMLGELETTYTDALARATKTGPYATIQGAAEAVLQTPISDILAEVEAEARPIISIPTPDEASNMEPEDGPEDPDEKQPDPDLAAFAKKWQERQAERREEEANVTLNGELITPDADGSDEVLPTVPTFVTVRDANGPYVISIDEYMEDSDVFSKQDVTYFEGDGILIDARESIVGSLAQDRSGIDRTIGVKNLDRWGQGTTDKDQVYIRNERLEIDFEVTRDKGTYTRQVLNIKAEDEIARSMTKPLKMREGDDS